MIDDEMCTDRLLMRRWRDEDREPFAAMNADPEVMRYLLHPLDRAESDAYVERIERHFDERGFGLWALEVRETGQFIGFTGLNPMPQGVPGEGGFEVGWRLAREAWGSGFATEAALSAIGFAFGQARFEEVWSLTAVVNTPSIAVMRRVGMTEAARIDHPRIEESHPLRPHVIYRLGAAK